MLSEIKDVVEKRRSAEAGSLAALSSAAPFGSRLHADLTFDYRDRCRLSVDISDGITNAILAPTACQCRPAEACT